MTLAVTHGHGGEPADSLKLTDIADPPLPEPSHVLVRVRMFAIHPGNEHGAHPHLGALREIVSVDVKLVVRVPDSGR
jgi:hypothetical protein